MSAISVQSAGSSALPEGGVGPTSAARPYRIRRILIATDGSTSSERAGRIAIDIAKGVGAALEILTVVPTAPDYHLSYFGATAGGPPYTVDDRTRAHHREVVARLKERAGEAGVGAVAAEVLEGDPSDQILFEARSGRVGLVVLGARGVSASHRILLGSVSNAVATRSAAPVLVVRGTTGPAAPNGRPMFERVFAALDGTPASFRALDVGIAIARVFGAPLDILDVVPIPPTPGVPDARRREAHALHVAQELTERARRRATELEVKEVRAEVLRGSAADAILSYIGDRSRTLVVVGSRGLSRPRSLLLGSVSTALLHHAPASVLIAREPRGT
jgi:nucleotide-binding universal stress UspA family protein